MMNISVNVQWCGPQTRRDTAQLSINKTQQTKELLMAKIPWPWETFTFSQHIPHFVVLLLCYWFMKTQSQNDRPLSKQTCKSEGCIKVRENLTWSCFVACSFSCLLVVFVLFFCFIMTNEIHLFTNYSYLISAARLKKVFFCSWQKFPPSVYSACPAVETWIQLMDNMKQLP